MNTSIFVRTCEGESEKLIASPEKVWLQDIVRRSEGKSQKLIAFFKKSWCDNSPDGDQQAL